MRIILASTSPRRRELLKMMGLVFDVVASNYEEVHDETRSVKAVVEELGIGKVTAVADIHPDAVVVGGDTIVAFESKQLGKPTDKEDARRMLKQYSGKNCQVLSSAAVVYRSGGYSFVDSRVATIQFKDIPDETVERYLATENYVDKAGGFALQHPIIQEVIDRVDGRIDSVVGLPTEVLRASLNELGIKATSIGSDDLLTMYV